MGIPFYFKNIVNRHNEIVTPASKHKLCSRLFLDFNCIVHQCANIVIQNNPLASLERLEELIIKDALDYIVKIINIAMPKDLLYIAVDGLCPRSKMQQQRKRRYISSWKNAQIAKMQGITLEQIKWDSNCITPGTTFMDKLDKSLLEFGEKNDGKLGFKIIVSQSAVPGEGEYKIFKYIRETDVNDLIDIIYGLDADLIMLSLISKNSNKIYLLREKPVFNISTPINAKDEFLLLDIKSLSKALTQAHCPDDDNFVAEYVILCTLIGNDFIPPLSFLKIKEDGIDHLINSYLSTRSFLGQRIIQDESLNWMFIKELFSCLSRNENTNMKQVCHSYYTKTFFTNSKLNALESLMSQLDNYPIIHKCKHVIDPSDNGWRQTYFKHIVNDANVVDVCNNYIEGVNWVYNYYFKGNCSNSWYYKYNYSPTICDVHNRLCVSMHNTQQFLDELHIKTMITTSSYQIVEKNPQMQLLLVLPPSSSHLISLPYQCIVKDLKKGCVHFYPIKFEITNFLKYYLWECSPILPDINIDYFTQMCMRAINQNEQR